MTIEDENVVVWPVCQLENCGRRILDIEQVVTSAPVKWNFQIPVMPPATGDYVTVAKPCGHVQPHVEGLVWVVRDGEPDCGA